MTAIAAGFREVRGIPDAMAGKRRYTGNPIRPAVIEAASVIIQVLVFKLTGRRVFKIAPIHHHFELLGWDENKVVVRFWIAQAAFASTGFFLYYIFLYNAAG